MTLDWWWEIASAQGDRWEISYSEPASRRLWQLDRKQEPVNVQPLQELLIRMRREGIPVEAKQIRAAVPLYKIETGDFRLQIQIDEAKQVICVNRLSHPALSNNLPRAGQNKIQPT